MKEIIIKKIHMENFKKFKDKTIEFNEKSTSIFAQNYKGKSSIADAFTWVLFNKSASGNTEGSQFKPRRYDENGNNIDHVDVVCELVLMIDGIETKIRKAQIQKWVRHRGEDFDSYTGDETKYEWNDVPVTATDHKKRVEDIISEEILRMITNPAAFVTMPAKKQREFLTTNIANITDDDVFATSSEFEPVKAAMGNNTLSELIAKNSKEITAYKKKMEEIPTRIDQESKHIGDIDFTQYENKLAELNLELKENEEKIEDTSKSYIVLNELKAEKAKLEGDLIQITARIDSELANNHSELKRCVDAAFNEFNTHMEVQKQVENRLSMYTNELEAKQGELKLLRSRYMEEMNKVINDDSYVCPTCGQNLPEDQKEKIKADFEKNKADTLSMLDKNGRLIGERVKELEKLISDCETDIENQKNGKIEAMGKEKAAKEKLEAFKNNPVSYDSDSSWCETKKKISELEEKIADINTSDADALKERLKEERATIQSKIDEVKEVLLKKSEIEKSKATVEELKAEMIKVTQSLANCEKLENLINKFNRHKMDMLSEKINDKFKLIKWKLFDKQKNGLYAEVCVCMINGSPYGENTTSTTERMMAGMDIISTLQEIYQVKAPIFLDDADLYNTWNIPDMDCQLIKLCVSDDEELRVEVE